jgi:hypothetical protein
MIGNEQVTSQKSSHEIDLRDYKNINNSLMQDALKIWSDLWAELDSSRRRITKPNDPADTHSIGIPDSEDRFEPSCGCSEFVKKMWVLRSYLDFAKRLSR